MRIASSLSFDAPQDSYEEEANGLLIRARAGDADVLAAFKWGLPRFSGQPVATVDPQLLLEEDARRLVADLHAFDAWTDLMHFADSTLQAGEIYEFERAVEAVVSGNYETLAAILEPSSSLTLSRSTRRHNASLLHYVAANGVENHRQKTPTNAVAILTQLLKHGADVNATARFYGGQYDTLSLLVSSAHPAEAGLQVAMAEVLIENGAVVGGQDEGGRSLAGIALSSGYLETARMLVRRGVPVDSFAIAAGLGLDAEAGKLLREATYEERHAGFALAAQHGQESIVELLLQAGEDPNRYNPDGFHGHTVPLHQAIWANHVGVVRLLIANGARLDIPDTIYEATPVDWAVRSGNRDMIELMRAAERD